MQNQNSLFYTRLATTLGCILLLLVSGCASKYGTQTTQVRYYPQCYQPIADLRAAEENFNNTMIVSTTVGALLGAVVGGVHTGDARGAAAGATIGAVAGAGSGYLLAKYQDEQDSRVRMAGYARELNTDISNLDRVKAAATVASKCYIKQFERALDAYKNKQISKDELNARYTEIKQGLQEASNILGSTLNGAQEREQQYQNVLTSEANRLAMPVTSPSRTEPKTAHNAKKTRLSKKKDPSLQGLANQVDQYNDSTQQLAQVKSDIDEVQLQMDKVMLAQR